MSTYIESLNTLTRQYNDAIRALIASYDMETSQSVLNLGSSRLRRQYDVLKGEYMRKRRQLFNDYKLANPEWFHWRKIWGWTFVVGVLLAMVCCGAYMPADESAPTSSTLMDGDGASSETIYWNAENIPIPYLQDATQYVSNPDSVLTQGAVDRMNITLQKLEKELGIQSVVIVVNHIENDDPFRMAQDVGNKYGVGYGDKGLMVVVGYQDHSINMSPGRSLEGDLTDAECHRLEQQYVVPAMRAEMPDSGMVYLVEAVYSTLQKKELPQMSQLSGQHDDELDDEAAAAIGLAFLFLTGWCIFYLRLNRKYQWLGLLGTVPLIVNPFQVVEHVSFGGRGGGFGGGGFGGGGGGGGFSGGSFGGGSFGGGGATSRW